MTSFSCYEPVVICGTQYVSFEPPGSQYCPRADQFYWQSGGEPQAKPRGIVWPVR